MLADERSGVTQMSSLSGARVDLESPGKEAVETRGATQK